MARSALGEGPSGFSFDASLMIVPGSTPSSRAVSSIGFPGSYTPRSRNWGLASSHTDVMRERLDANAVTLQCAAKIGLNDSCDFNATPQDGRYQNVLGCFQLLFAIVEIVPRAS